MKLRTLIAAAVTGAFALPFAAQASAPDNTMILAQAGGPAGASASGTGAPGGVPRAGGPGSSGASTGEPQSSTAASARSAATGSTGGMAPTFEKLDTNSDGQISRAEWDAHHRSEAGAGSGATTRPSVANPSSSPTDSPGTSRQPQPK